MEGRYQGLHGEVGGSHVTRTGCAEMMKGQLDAINVVFQIPSLIEIRPRSSAVSILMAIGRSGCITASIETSMRRRSSETPIPLTISARLLSSPR